MEFRFNDGGRSSAGYKRQTGDCVARAIAIVTGKPYQEVYDALAHGNATQKRGKREGAKAGVRTASRGINTKRKWFQEYMRSLGFTWTPTMFVGQGCKVHLKADELPKGRLVVAVSKHFTAVIDGVINDTYNPQRGGGSFIKTVNGVETRGTTPERCVYGYFTYNGIPAPKPISEEIKIHDIGVRKSTKDTEKLNKLMKARKRWETKRKRADGAIKKLNKKIKYYESKSKAK